MMTFMRKYWNIRGYNGYNWLRDPRILFIIDYCDFIHMATFWQCGNNHLIVCCVSKVKSCHGQIDTSKYRTNRCNFSCIIEMFILWNCRSVNNLDLTQHIKVSQVSSFNFQDSFCSTSARRLSSFFLNYSKLSLGRFDFEWSRDLNIQPSSWVEQWKSQIGENMKWN